MENGGVGGLPRVNGLFPASVAVSSMARPSSSAAARVIMPWAVSALTMVVTVLGRMCSSRAS